MREFRQDLLIGLSIAMLLVLSGTTWWLWERVEKLATNITILTQEDLGDAVMIPSVFQFWRTQHGSSERPTDGKIHVAHDS